MYTPWASLRGRRRAGCGARASSWARVCAELRGIRSTVVAVDPRDLGLSFSHGRPDQRSPAVLVHAKPLERPHAVGGTPKRAGNNKLVLCTWLDLPSVSEGEVRLVQGVRWSDPQRSHDASACVLRRNKISTCQRAQTLREWSARATSIRKGALRHRQLHAGRSDRPKCYHQEKVFYELNPSKIELLLDVFSVFTPSPLMPSPLARS